MKACALKPHIKLRNGEIVESILFRDLKEALGQKEAKKYYGFLTNPKFKFLITQFTNNDKSHKVYDENGEYTINTAFEVLTKLGFDVTNKQYNALTKEYSSKQLNLSGTLSAIKEFNTKSPLRKYYTAIPIKVESSNKSDLNNLLFTISFIKNDKETSVIEGQKATQNLIALDKLVNIFKAKNIKVNVQTIHKGLQTLSVKDFLKTIDILGDNPYELKENAINTSASLIYDCMEGTDLRSRLESLVEKNDEAEKREYIESLLRDELREQLENTSKFKTLVKRIINWASRKIFSRNTKNDLERLRLEIENVTSEYLDLYRPTSISESFHAKQIEEFEKNSQDAVLNLEGKLSDMTKELAKLMTKLNSKSNENFKIITENIFIDVEKVFNSDVESTIEKTREALINQSIYTLIAGLNDFFRENDIENKLNYLKSNIEDLVGDKLSKLKESAGIITSLRSIQNAIKNITSTYTDYIELKSNEDSSIKERVSHVYEAAKDLNKKAYDMEEKLVQLETTLFRQLIQRFSTIYDILLDKNNPEVNALQYQTVVGIFNTNHKPFITGDDYEVGINNRLQLASSIVDRYSYTTMFNNISESIFGRYERWLSSMSNNPDYVGTVVDTLIKVESAKSDEKALNYGMSFMTLMDRFKAIQKKYRDIHIKYDDLFEVIEDENGNKVLTGNIVSEFNQGLLEQKISEYNKKLWEEFKTNPENAVYLKSSLPIKYRAFHDFADGKIKEFVKSQYHSVKVNGQYVSILNDEYKSKQWDDLPVELQDLLKDYFVLKTNVDNEMGTGHTKYFRAPQFTRRQMEGLQGVMGISHKLERIKSWFKAYYDQYDVIRDLKEESYGSDITDPEDFTTVIDDVDIKPLISNYDYRNLKSSMHRIPLYGIKKIRNKNDLEKNIFLSALPYVSMAMNYSNMSNIADALEIGSTVLHRRKSTSIRDSAVSMSASRYDEYKDLMLYHESNRNKREKSFKKTVDKLLNTGNGLASLMWIYGNTKSGTINGLTGFTRVLMETRVGEISGKGLRKAIELYVNCFASNILHSFQQNKYDKVSLLMNRWNAIQTRRENLQNLGNKKGVISAIEDIGYFMFKSTDFFMHAIPYLAVAEDVKLYTNVNGKAKQVSLLDSYDRVDYINEKASKLKKAYLTRRVAVLKKELFKSEKNHDSYYELEEALESIKKSLETSTSVNIHIEAKAKNILNEYNILLGDTMDRKSVKQAIQLITEKKDSLLYTTEDETRDILKARELCLRIHGINKNKFDRVGLANDLITSSLLTMKGWALGLAEKYYSKRHYNESLKRFVEGEWNTIYKAVVSEWKEKQTGINGNIEDVTFLEHLGHMLCYAGFAGASRRRLRELGFADDQVTNIKRHYLETYMLNLGNLFQVIMPIPGEEDAPEGEWYAIVYYFYTRLLRELSTLTISTATVRFWQDTATLFDIVPCALSAAWDIEELLKLGVETVIYKSNPEFAEEKLGIKKSDVAYTRDVLKRLENEGENIEGLSREGKKYLRENTTLYKFPEEFERVFPHPWWKTALFLQDPVSSYKTFNYGKMVRK